MPDLIFFHGPDTTIIGYHAPSETLLAVPPEQFLGKRIVEVFPPDQAELFATAVTEAIVSRTPGRLEYTIQTPDGMLDFEARYIPSGVDEIMAIVRDVTALRQSERQAIILTLEKERTRLLTEFIRNASHEFRTPLSVIGSSAYLMARTDDPERRRYRLEQIEASVVRTTKLVDMLLKMALLDARLPDPAPINLTRAIELLQTEILSPADAARIHFDVPVDLPPVSGYETLLTDALRQIVENALRYTPPEGQISVRASAGEHTLVVEIADTGIGIAEDALPHIFETFWRQDEAHSTPGLGLGLSIAQKIVDLHGGRVEVESEAGKGSTFRVILPRSNP
jgi:signal transduction histidine kinase